MPTSWNCDFLYNETFWAAVSAIATLIASGIAWYAVHSWKAQYRANVRGDLGRKYRVAVYKMRDAITTFLSHDSMYSTNAVSFIRLHKRVDKWQVNPLQGRSEWLKFFTEQISRVRRATR
jgi:hypothetical protein